MNTVAGLIIVIILIAIIITANPQILDSLQGNITSASQSISNMFNQPVLPVHANTSQSLFILIPVPDSKLNRCDWINTTYFTGSQQTIASCSILLLAGTFGEAGLLCTSSDISCSGNAVILDNTTIPDDMRTIWQNLIPLPASTITLDGNNTKSPLKAFVFPISGSTHQFILFGKATLPNQQITIQAYYTKPQ